MPRRDALFFLRPASFDDIYAEARAALAERVYIAEPVVTEEIYRDSTRIWRGIEMIFSGWGMVTCDQQFLERFPDLKIVFYGSGSIRHFITDSFWDKGVRITSGAAANAIPVSEYTLSQVLFGLKQGWQSASYVRKHRHYPANFRPAGGYRSAVGLISLGLIGRRVAQRLRSFDLRVLAYDPFVTEAEALELGIELVSLEELFRASDVVSCHAPDLEKTRKMIGAAHFASMKPGATFINTARGRIVDETGMTDVLQKRSDLVAVLDVTHPEPPVADSPLYRLDNIILTPHIAGSIGTECRRMGQLMVEELDRYLAGAPLRHEIQREEALLLA